jgi:hypothetical protein
LIFAALPADGTPGFCETVTRQEGIFSKAPATHFTFSQTELKIFPEIGQPKTDSNPNHTSNQTENIPA